MGLIKVVNFTLEAGLIKSDFCETSSTNSFNTRIIHTQEQLDYPGNDRQIFSCLRIYNPSIPSIDRERIGKYFTENFRIDCSVQFGQINILSDTVKIILGGIVVLVIIAGGLYII